VPTITNLLNLGFSIIPMQPKQPEISFPSCYWVAQNEKYIVGYIEAMMIERPPIHAHRRIGYIGSIYVKPEARRRGIGGKLWQLAYDWLVEKGVPTISLSVAWQNPIALEFWKKLNFREIMVRFELDSS
jgi:ribosomal protein S18 acetylase RimI-like enzyme